MVEDTQEQWRPIAPRPQYEVSNLGRVRGPQGLRRPKIDPKDGYARIILGPRPCLTRTVHALVAEAFLGPRPIGYIVAHKNSQRADNRADNLQYTTWRANLMHRRAAGTGVCPLLAMENKSQRINRGSTKGKARGERHGRTILTTEVVERIHAEYARNPNCSRIDRLLGLPSGRAADVVAGRSWRHIHPDATMRG